jgi:hypothetical protein
MRTTIQILQIFGGVLGVSLVAYFTPSTYRTWKEARQQKGAAK